jgi:WD40 repeat protein
LILETETGRLVRSISLPSTWVNFAAWSPDGATLATAYNDDKIYLWDTGTGTRKATLEGRTNGGLTAAFHPSGTLLASNSWGQQLWLWDPALGRPWFSLTGVTLPEFSRDGRIVVALGDDLTTYRVDPALEYRTLAYASGSASIRYDGRVLAVSTWTGVLFWDLDRGVEIAHLAMPVSFLQFDPSGNLLTSTVGGVLRWPFQLDPERDEFRIGPPRPHILPGGTEEMAADRSGQIVALASFDVAFVRTPERTFAVGPLDDCRYVAVSPDGQWLATGSHGKNGFQVWRLQDSTQVAHPVKHDDTRVRFSPDGRWLMSTRAPCRLWEVGTWREAPQKIGGSGLCFSPDGRLLVVQDASKAIRLVETDTGRTLARLESPDLYAVSFATFSPDSSRLVITTPDGPAVHVWDLRAIRHRLAGMGLDWDAPAFSGDDRAGSTLPLLPPLKVDYGPVPPTDSPDPKLYEPLIADLETMLARQPDQPRIGEMLARFLNTCAWRLATAPEPTRDPQRAISLARRAVELRPKAAIYLNTLGVALHRAGRYPEAIATLEKSLAAGRGQTDAFDLFFLAMARFEVGQIDRARADFDRAVKWRRDHPNLAQPGWSAELDAFQAEARALLDGPPPALPTDAFAPESPNRE